MTRILITGSGLLGNHVAKTCVRHGWPTLLVDNANKDELTDYIVGHGFGYTSTSVTDLRKLNGIFADFKPDVVVHTAGVMERLFQESPADAAETNIQGSINVLRATACNEVKQFVFASSLAVYDFSDPQHQITEESRKTETSLYGLGKLTVENCCAAMAQKYSFGFVGLRFCGIYGISRFTGGAWMASRLFNIVNYLITAPEATIELDEESFATNEYLHVKSAAQAVINAIESNPSSPQVMNVGADQLTSIEDLRDSLSLHFPLANIVIKPADRPLADFMQRKHPLDIHKAREVIGYQPILSKIDDGLSDMIQEIILLRSRNPWLLLETR